jgi:hypothetical protein
MAFTVHECSSEAMAAVNGLCPSLGAQHEDLDQQQLHRWQSMWGLLMGMLWLTTRELTDIGCL